MVLYILTQEWLRWQNWLLHILVSYVQMLSCHLLEEFHKSDQFKSFICGKFYEKPKKKLFFSKILEIKLNKLSNRINKMIYNNKLKKSTPFLDVTQSEYTSYCYNNEIYHYFIVWPSC